MHILIVFFFLLTCSHQISQLLPTEFLDSSEVNNKLVSPNGLYTATLGLDGNFVLRDSSSAVLWQSATPAGAAPHILYFQGDSNGLHYAVSAHSRPELHHKVAIVLRNWLLQRFNESFFRK